MAALRKLQEQVKNSLKLISVGNAQDAIVQITKLIKSIKQVQNVQTVQANQELEIIAYNNLACAYSKSNKFNASLKCLMHVQQIQQNILDNVTLQNLTQQKILQIAMTHSNKCAVYSKMKQHLKAKRSIEKAIKILQMKPQSKQSKFYLICLYNYSIQQEALGNLNESKAIVQEALMLVNEKGTFNEMRQKFQSNLTRIANKILNRQSKINNYIKNNLLSTDRSLFFDVNKRIKGRNMTPKNQQIQIASHQNYDSLLRRKINFSHQLTEHKSSSYFNKSQQMSPIKILNLNKIYKSGKMPRCNTAGTKRAQSPYHPKRPSTGKKISPVLRLDQF